MTAALGVARLDSLARVDYECATVWTRPGFTSLFLAY